MDIKTSNLTIARNQAVFKNNSTKIFPIIYQEKFNI